MFYECDFVNYTETIVTETSPPSGGSVSGAADVEILHQMIQLSAGLQPLRDGSEAGPDSFC